MAMKRTTRNRKGARKGVRGRKRSRSTSRSRVARSGGDRIREQMINEGNRPEERAAEGVFVPTGNEEEAERQKRRGERAQAEGGRQGAEGEGDGDDDSGGSAS